MFIPLNITGETHQSRSKPLSNQVSQNFYSELADNTAVKSPFVLHGFPGMLLHGTIASGKDRGMIFHQQVVYKVTGTKLYSVASDGTHTELGDIPGSSRCILDGIGSNVVITTGGSAYVWDGSTISTVSDPDLETPNSCTHLNNQIIYDGDGGRFGSSDVGDATNIDGLNYATAESRADDLLRVKAFDQLLYLLGVESIEVWWNSGVGNPPFDRLQGGIIEVGLGALYSASCNKDYMYLLGNDNQVYQIKQTSKNVVSTIGIHGQIAEFDTIDDAIGFCFTLEGQNFYLVNFPSADKSFLFSEKTGWHTLSSGNKGGRSFANSYVFGHRKHLVADYRGGNIYEWKLNQYTDNDEEIIRIRDTAPLHSGLFGKPGKNITINYLELVMETGVGLVSGQGSNPKISLSISDNGGRTFGTENWSSIGKSGDFQQKVIWTALGQYQSPIFRFMISDPIPISIHSAGADIEVGI